MIDLRSDTVTKPSLEMRQVMASAEVGDDCYGDDPTVNALEEEVAGILGKEAAVFMPTGTMTNQVAIRTHTEPGDAILFDQHAHIYQLQCGAPFALSGVHPRLLNGVRGVFTADDVTANVPLGHPFFPKAWAPPSKLLCVENTHNLGCGKIWPLEQLNAVTDRAASLGLKRHLDGARLWHASVATGISEASYAAAFDSVSVCFSKGLGAPMGSALVGSRAFIDRARRFKGQFGGAFRQAGIVAAGALYALQNNRPRLAEDHANAKLFAEGIARIPGVIFDPTTVETNIVRFRVTVTNPGALAMRAHQRGVYFLSTGSEVLRACMHLDVSRAQVLEALEVLRSEMAAAMDPPRSGSQAVPERKAAVADRLAS
jgi:threonine aldolase